MAAGDKPHEGLGVAMQGQSPGSPGWDPASGSRQALSHRAAPTSPVLWRGHVAQLSGGTGGRGPAPTPPLCGQQQPPRVLWVPHCPPAAGAPRPGVWRPPTQLQIWASHSGAYFWSPCPWARSCELGSSACSLGPMPSAGSQQRPTRWAEAWARPLLPRASPWPAAVHPPIPGPDAGSW